MAKFFEMLERRWQDGARVCVGLDSDRSKIPDFLLYTQGAYPDVRKFNRTIIEATADIALCYKPNIAFYSGAFHKEAQEVLAHTIDDIRDIAPDVPVILDAKRADIGNTNGGYVDEAFLNFEADAVTVNPYFGMEAMKPFLDQNDKGIIVLCKTSNPGSAEFQDAILVAADPPNRSMPMYKFVAERVSKYWNYNGNCALVVGATYPEQLGEVRQIVGNMWLLVPGIGTQGGDVEKVVRNGLNSRGNGLIINSSSGIIFASKGVDYAEAARQKMLELTEQINSAISKRRAF
ncbi:MAG: orotidine-5'-phosphate decarboxylase [Patescibacteria group bacterium]